MDLLVKGRLLFFASEEKKNHFTLNVVCAKNKNPSFFLNMSSISYRDVANQPISTIAIKTDCTWISVNEHSILKSVHCTETSTAWQQIPVVTRESVAKNLLQAVWFVTRLDLDRTPPHNPRVKKDVPEACVVLVEHWERRAKRRRSLTEEEHA